MKYTNCSNARGLYSQANVNHGTVGRSVVAGTFLALYLLHICRCTCALHRFDLLSSIKCKVKVNCLNNKY